MNKDTIVNEIILSMTPHLNSDQLLLLKNVLSDKLKDIKLECTDLSCKGTSNEHYLELFTACKSIEGLSMRSLNQYRYAVRRFADTMHVDLIRCTTDYVRAYLAKLAMSGVSKSSLNTTRAYLSSFYNWLYLEGYTDKNIVARIPKVKQEKRQAPTLTPLQFESIRSACKTDRELALIDLLGSTGMRCSEICDFKMSDINFTNGTIIIHGKGAKDRVGRINARLQISLDKYLTDRGYVSDYIFGKSRGKHDRVTTTSIEQTVKDIAKRVNIDVHIHMFRHYFCTQLIRKGMPVHEVQLVMGHESLDTTIKVYTEIQNEDVQQNLKKFCA